MNLSKNWIRSFLLLALGLLATSVSLRAETVTISDTNLATAIRKQLGIENTSIPVTQDDMLKLYTLNARGSSGSSSKITNLTGLKYATKLRYLDLSENSLTNVSELSSLTELTYLDLSFNTALEDASPLASLYKLNTLGLGGTKVKNLDFLASLAQLQQSNPPYALERLYIGKLIQDINEYGITNIDVVAQFPSLSTLSAEYNRISSIESLIPLINETKSLKYLNLFGNYINSIEHLIPSEGKTSGLVRLNLGFNYITKLDGLTRANFTDVDELLLNGNFLDTADGSATRAILKPFEDIGTIAVNYAQQREDIWANLLTFGTETSDYRPVQNKAFFPEDDYQVIFKKAPHFKWSESFGYIYFSNEKQKGSDLFAYFFSYDDLGWTWVQMDSFRAGYVYSFTRKDWVNLFQE